MSRERLQEHFSALYEGSLDTGLAQQIQKRFEADPELKADYQEFCLMMEMLGDMPSETIEVPTNLSSRITDRLDTATTQRSIAPLFGWAKLFGFGSLATVALVASIVALNSKSGGPVTASMVPSIGATPAKVLDTILLSKKLDTTLLIFNASGPKTLTVFFWESGETMKKAELNGSSVVYSLKNSESSPAVYGVEVTGDKSEHLIVIPGTSSAFDLQGSGKLAAFLRGISARFSKVLHVQVPTGKLDEIVEWDVKTEDANSALSSILMPKDFSISTDADGIISIVAH